MLWEAALVAPLSFRAAGARNEWVLRSAFPADSHGGNAMQKFGFRPGARVRGVDPDVAGRELKQLEKRGPLTPQSVVDASRNPRAPLHPCFEWDDSVAAESHRRWQARNLIMSVVVIQRQADESEPTLLQAYIHEPSAKCYQPIDVVARDEDARRGALHELRLKIVGLQRTIRQILDRVPDGSMPVKLRRGLARFNGEIERLDQLVEQVA